jgi:hypothetical protein
MLVKKIRKEQKRIKKKKVKPILNFCQNATSLKKANELIVNERKKIEEKNVYLTILKNHI